MGLVIEPVPERPQTHFTLAQAREAKLALYDIAGRKVVSESGRLIGTVDDAKALLLVDSGVTRVSMGAQSFDRAVLTSLERVHDPASVRRAMAEARAAGYTNVNVDLIYGAHGETLESWERSLHEAIDLGAAVATGAEAFEALMSGHFDCVVLDLRLPDVSGFELLTRIQAEPKLQNVPIVVFTGKDLSPDEQAEIKTMAKSIVLKDVQSPERLLPIRRALLVASLGSRDLVGQRRYLHLSPLRCGSVVAPGAAEPIVAPAA